MVVDSAGRASGTAWWKQRARSRVASAGGEAGGVDVGAQEACVVFHVPVGSGVGDEGGDLGGEGGGAQVESGQQLLGQVEFVIGLVGFGEGEDERALGLGGGPFTGDAVFFGFRAGVRVSGGGAGHVGLDPPHVAQDAVVAAFPAEGPGGFEGGREVSGEPGQVGETALCGGCETASSVGDVLHTPAGGVAAPEVALGFGLVVDGHLVEFRGQQTGVDDCGEPVGGALAVLVLSAGQGAEGFDQGVGGCLQLRLRTASAQVILV
ncbi:hypothetical protein ACIRQP_42050 [Streptomyces sp. NPDC102274]|uniref:hypothetical protein n=1 Tax=Streptomyces sp. NPDC102274 TaxID=3366151 RepID=UPI003825313E